MTGHKTCQCLIHLSHSILKKLDSKGNWHVDGQFDNKYNVLNSVPDKTESLSTTKAAAAKPPVDQPPPLQLQQPKVLWGKQTIRRERWKRQGKEDEIQEEHVDEENSAGLEWP